MEPYLNFFDASSTECRLYNDHKEYLAYKMDSGLQFIVPQELVEYLNVRTSYREFERPLLHIFAGALSSTIGLNGIMDSAEPEYQDFMTVFYKPGCSFCLTEGSYSLDHEALLRFPYLDASFPQMPPDYRLGTSRDNRRMRYLKDPAPSIRGDESNGLEGRKYRELSQIGSKDKYFQHFMFPIRDVIESEAMAARRRASASPLSMRSRSTKRLYKHEAIDANGRGTHSFYGRSSSRLGSFSRFRGGARRSSRARGRRARSRHSTRRGHMAHKKQK